MICHEYRLTAYENNLKKNRPLEKKWSVFGRTNMDPGPSSVPGVLLMLHHNQYNLTVYERYDIKIRVSPGFNGFPAACGNVLGRRISP